MAATWAALGRTPSGMRAFLMQDARLLAEAEGPDEAGTLAGLGETPARILRLGEGPASRLPTALMPETQGTCPAMEQESPPDIIGAWVRLRLLGLMQAQPNWDGVACVQEGDVSHWVHLSAGEAVSCQSFLTPRLIAALGGAATPCTNALEDTLSRPERLADYLRRADVTGQPAAITGHLIGAELAAAKPYWLGQNVALIARPGSAYGTALTAQGLPHSAHDPDTLFAQGLAALGQ